MGAWGHEYEENDTYLDIFDEMMEIIEGKLKRSFKDSFAELQFVSAAGLLYDICKNPTLRYNGTEETLKMASEGLTEILTGFSLQSWSKPDKRKKVIKDFRDKIDGLIKEGTKSTSLVDKFENSTGGLINVTHPVAPKESVE